MGELEVVEERELLRFEHADLYIVKVNELVEIATGPVPPQASASREAWDSSIHRLSKELDDILDEYQEQPYLLDPYLEDIVQPPVKALQQAVRDGRFDSTAIGLRLVAHQAYFYTKVRGYKSITPFFPHEVDDLIPVLSTLERLTDVDNSSYSSWELRYILLLWLSLVCMIPFDLHKFTSTSREADTASRLVSIGQVFLSRPGKERDAAAVMLGKLFQRRDTADTHLHRFVGWCREELGSQTTPILATGILQALCEIVKTSDAAAVASHLPDIQGVLSLYDTDSGVALQRSALVTKYQTKLTSRLGLKLLRPRSNNRSLKVKGLSDPHMPTAAAATEERAYDAEDDEDEVPEEIEALIASLIESLQHKDTVVRYSAAKGLARLCQRLPPAFIDQVTDAVVELFSLDIPDILGDRADLSSVSESTWQGACLALAELARRGLLSSEGLEEKVAWIEKALHFDVRRGAHSVGANVRDAACYVLWALARAHDPEAIRPRALQLARSLVAVSLLDRDISIRRAASAAYQECVGRMNLFPHGIDVIRKTDFYAVGIRRTAFLDSTPQVAIHDEYRTYLLDQLLSTTTIHWDVSMREIGAQAVRHIARLDFATLGSYVYQRMVDNLSKSELSTVHGSLLTLAQIGSEAVQQEHADLQAEIFLSIGKVNPRTYQSQGGHLILQAACNVIAASVAEHGISLASIPQAAWENVVALSLARQEEAVQAIAEWPIFTVSQRQSHVLVLGSLDYSLMESMAQDAVIFLLSVLDSRTTAFSSNIETRRNTCTALVTAVSEVSLSLAALPNTLFGSVLEALIRGLDDYTTDQRGDVGSWVRLECITGLPRLLSVVASLSREDAAFDLSAYVPEALLVTVLAGIVKQTTERIDNVRAVAGENLLKMRDLMHNTPSMAIPDVLSALDSLYPRDERPDFKSPSWQFPRVVTLLALPVLRPPLLNGLVLAIGSNTDMAHRVVGAALSDFVLSGQAKYTSLQLMEDLYVLAKASYRTSRQLIPILETINLLLEAGVAESLPQEDGSAVLRKILALVTRGIDAIKTVQRIMECMNINVNLIAFPPIRQEAVAHLPTFLSHAFPTIRTATCEKLYLVVQSSDLEFDNPAGAETVSACDDDGNLDPLEQLEELLLETDWSDARQDCFSPEALKVQRLLGLTR